MPRISIEEVIRRAIEEGRFSDLPGKGKPLRLEDNPHEDPGWRMAHKILQNGGFSLPWIESLREIEEELGSARAALGRSWIWRQAAIRAQEPRPDVEAEWQRAQAEFRERLSKINRRISTYNLEAPSIQFQRPALNIDVEIEKVKDSQPDEK